MKDPSDLIDRLRILVDRMEACAAARHGENISVASTGAQLASSLVELKADFDHLSGQRADAAQNSQSGESSHLDPSGTLQLRQELERIEVELHEARVEAETARRDVSRLRSFGQILDRSDNEIYIFGADSLRFLHVNHGACENLGYSMDELRELTPLDLKPEFSAGQFEALVAPLRHKEVTRVHFATVHRRKDGSLYPVDVHLELSVFEDRPAFVAVIVDATTRRKLEVDLRQSREDAVAADRAKSDFLANMSHEIRTPMTAILGYADLLLEEGDISRAPKGRINAIRTIQRNGQHLLSLINDILDHSKIEAGKLSLESISCSPKAIVDDVLSLMSIRAQSKNIALSAVFETPLPAYIYSDPTRIRQILVNLVSNAIKFTDAGRVQIIARFLSGASGKIEVDVVDTGIGISSEQMQHLFQPFTQSDSTTTRRFGGTGLGLTISKRLAEMLRGDVFIVESSPGRGTRIRLSFDPGSLEGIPLALTEVPVGECTGDGVPEASAKHTAPLAGFRLLLADDSPDNQRLLQYVLQRAGAKVTVVGNGQQAIEAALIAADLNQPYDVVLMDMQMPVLDGYSATAALREGGYREPIIALTAHAMSGDREKCLAAGCDDYATKPIDRPKLVAQIQSLCQRAVAAGPSA